jgi:hypothetical protein
MKILFQCWSFGKVTWGMTWTGSAETTIRDLKLVVCLALGKPAAAVEANADQYVARMSFLSWDNIAAKRSSGQVLQDTKTLADYHYGDGEVITVGVDQNF